jgi:hypothetical protein
MLVPQFDLLIIFPIIKDLLIILIFYYIVFTNITIINLRVLKFREKASKFINFKLNTVLVFKSYF